MQHTFRFYQDSGHGWLKVPIDLLYRFGIADQVSGYSYERGEYAYLEEDCDMGLFLTEYKRRYGGLPKFTDRVSERSRIRDYARYYKRTRDF